MDNAPQGSAPRRGRTGLIVTVVVALAAAGAAGWWYSNESKPATPQAGGKAAGKGGGGPVTVSLATVERRDVPVRLRANGTVVALQSVDIRAQITSTVREVHIREGQNVGRGDLLVSLDSRAEEAALRKAEAQVEKDRADLANGERTLERQRQLFAQKFISQSALDAAQNQVETLRGQLAVDLAAVESAKVALANTQIRASFAGRTGAIGVRPGSLVQPNGAVLVTVTQVDPIQVSFTLPEKEFPGLQRALAAGPVDVEAAADPGATPFRGRVNFLDNAVDTATGTIRVKAQFANAESRLWPGMFVTVSLAPRVIAGASVLPVQAVQTGPDSRFVFVVDEERKAAVKTVTVPYLDGGVAVVTGLEPGTKVVLEGAQNLRAGSLVALGEGKAGPGKGGEGEGKGKAAS